MQSKKNGRAWPALQLQNSSTAALASLAMSMDDYIFSQDKGTTSAATASACSYKRSRKVRRFNPPLKKNQSQDSESAPSQYSIAATGTSIDTSVAGEERRVHTVLSYCSETSITQPDDQLMQPQLQSQEDEIAEELLQGSKCTITGCSSEGLLLDDSLLSNSGENVLSTEEEETDDGLAVLSTSPQQRRHKGIDPFRFPSGSKHTAIDYEDRPLELQSRGGCKEAPNVDGECSTSEEAIHLNTGTSVIPRREFKVPRPKTSVYNFSVAPKELAKTAAKRRRPQGLVCKRRPRLQTRFALSHITHDPLAAISGDSPQGELSVFEFHASQEQSRAAGNDDSDDGRGLERGGDSRSRIDDALSTRTREEQVSVLIINFKECNLFLHHTFTVLVT